MVLSELKKELNRVKKQIIILIQLFQSYTVEYCEKYLLIYDIKAIEYWSFKSFQLGLYGIFGSG